MPLLSIQMCTSSCTSVKIWAALESRPLMNTSGANSSLMTNPRNSFTDSFRRVFPRTIPLRMTRIPCASAVRESCRRNSSHVYEARLLCSTEREPLKSAETRSMPSPIRNLPTNGSFSAWRSSKCARYHSCFTRTSFSNSRKSGLSLAVLPSTTVRRSGIGVFSGGGSDKKRNPNGTLRVLAKSCALPNGGRVSPRSHASISCASAPSALAS